MLSDRSWSGKTLRFLYAPRYEGDFREMDVLSEPAGQPANPQFGEPSRCNVHCQLFIPSDQILIRFRCLGFHIIVGVISLDEHLNAQHHSCYIIV